MSLLKRLNAENTAAGSAPAPAPGTGTTGMAPSGTGPIGTGDLFVKNTGPVPAPGATGDLFQAPPRQTASLSEQTQQVQRARGTTKQDNFKEMKVRVQNRLIAELDPMGQRPWKPLRATEVRPHGDRLRQPTWR